MKKLKRILYPICAVILLVAAWNLWKIRQSTKNSTTLYQALADQAHTGEEMEKTQGASFESAEKVHSQSDKETQERAAEYEGKEPGTPKEAEEKLPEAARDAEGKLSMETGEPEAKMSEEACKSEEDLSEGKAREAAEEYTESASEVEDEESDDVRAGYDPIVNSWIVDLQKQNKDLAGWLRISGTNIDYPVMQTEEDNDFYMNHDFEGKEDPHGTPFLDVNCRIGQSENLIIYGHHMKDGTMFQNLMLYKDEEFCKKNGVLQFDTPLESVQYQLLYVLVMSEKEAVDFPYYQYIDMSEEKIYQEFLNQCARYAIWSGKEIPQTGTELLTLSTCEYSKENGRLVVVAAKM